MESLILHFTFFYVLKIRKSAFVIVLRCLRFDIQDIVPPNETKSNHHFRNLSKPWVKCHSLNDDSNGQLPQDKRDKGNACWSATRSIWSALVWNSYKFNFKFWHFKFVNRENKLEQGCHKQHGYTRGTLLHGSTVLVHCVLEYKYKLH